MSDMKIEQVDRIAAANHYKFVQSRNKTPHHSDLQDSTINEIKNGRWDNDEAVQAFTRHRLGIFVPEPDEAEALWGELREAVLYEVNSIEAMNAIRDVLAKARAHPADVVEAAREFKSMGQLSQFAGKKIITDYLMKDFDPRIGIG